jgi:hypothetical protein
MTEPTRLMDEVGGDELETSLLQLAKNEGPSMEGRRKILAAIAAGGAASLASQTADAATAAPGGALKWSLVGAGAAGVAIGAALLFGSANEPSRLPVAPPVVRAVPAAEQQASPAPAEAGPAPLTVDDLPTLKEPAGTAAPSAKQGSLADEVAQLQKAKLALKGGDAARALAELSTYSQRFPRPMLGAEATVVRIEALSASGDSARAKSLAEGFLVKNPNSPYAARLRSLTGAR